MMKLLFKPTGNIFTLPDSEALKIKASDRGNYEILDAGINEPEETVTITQEEVQKTIKAKEEKLKSEAEKENPEPVVKPSFFKQYDADINKMGKPELEVLAAKLGITDPHNKKKPELIARIKKLKGEQ